MHLVNQVLTVSGRNKVLKSADDLVMDLRVEISQITSELLTNNVDVVVVRYNNIAKYVPYAYQLIEQSKSIITRMFMTIEYKRVPRLFLLRKRGSRLELSVARQ